MKKTILAGAVFCLLVLMGCEHTEVIVEHTVLEFSRDVYEVDGKEQTFTVGLNKNTNFQLKSKPDWVSYLGIEKAAKSTQTVQLTFRVMAHLDPVDRRGEICLRYVGDDGKIATASFTLIQHTASLDNVLKMVYRGGEITDGPLIKDLVKDKQRYPFEGLVFFPEQPSYRYSYGESWKIPLGERQEVTVRGMDAGGVQFRNLCALEEIDFSEF